MLDEGKTKEETFSLINARPKERGSLISILQDIQAYFGYLPRDGMTEISNFLDIPESEVYSVATFYNQFRFVPPGKHQLKVCLGTACQIKGGRVILDSWARELDINEGETSKDREFSLDRVACVGCCAMAPVTVVDNVVESKVSPTRVKGILLAFELEREKSGKESG